MGRQATLDPARGGINYVNMRDGAQVAREIVEVDPPHRLVFAWGWTNDTAVPPCIPTINNRGLHCGADADRCPPKGQQESTAGKYSRKVQQESTAAGTTLSVRYRLPPTG
jgi:uncharacterized protein YndB with AHSA1/START domain